jgi:hypothetical protein
MRLQARLYRKEPVAAPVSRKRGQKRSLSPEQGSNAKMRNFLDNY